MRPEVDTAPSVPRPIPIGAEMTELMRFHRDVNWEGRVEPNGMGPGTPAMAAIGHGRHELIQDGRWVVGTYEQDQFLADGSFVLRWQLHWVAGWSPIQGEYRATVADNTGTPMSCAEPSMATSSRSSRRTRGPSGSV